MRPDPSLSTLILTLQGVVLGLGAGSALFVSQVGLGARLGLSRAGVEWTYAFGAAGLVLVGAVLLLVARRGGRWPFPAREAAVDSALDASAGSPEPSSKPAPSPTRSAAARYGATLLAGLGTGAYAGLLNHLTAGFGLHLATAIAYFGLLPLAFLAIVLGERTFGSACARLIVLMGAVELSAQLGLWWSQDRAYFDDLTAIDAAFLIGGAVFAAMVAIVQWARRPPLPTRTRAGRPPT